MMKLHPYEVLGLRDPSLKPCLKSVSIDLSFNTQSSVIIDLLPQREKKMQDQVHVMEVIPGFPI